MLINALRFENSVMVNSHADWEIDVDGDQPGWRRNYKRSRVDGGCVPFQSQGVILEILNVGRAVVE